MSLTIHPDKVVQQELESRGVDASVGVFGSHHVQIGKGAPVRLDEIQPLDIPYAGFKTATQVQRGRAGIEKCAADALRTLAATGELDAGKLLGALKAQQTHLERLDRLGGLDPAQKQDGEGLWMFTKAVEALSNEELAAVFQKFTSAEMDLLQTALLREGSVNPKAKDARMAAARLFNLQALVLKEVSNRASATVLADLRAANPQDETLAADKLRAPERLSAEYGHSGGGPEGPAERHVHDISAMNLNVLVETAASSATARERSAETEKARLDARGLDKVSVKQMGDVLRSAELTVNLDAEYLFAETGIIENPDKPMPNIWHLADKGIKPKGDAYLAKRDSVERTLFPEMSRHAPKADERPVYGALNYERNTFGAAPTYGHVTVVLKPEVRKRATFTIFDTFYASRATVTPERREGFHKLLDGTAGIPQSLKTALRDAGSAERRALEAWFDKLAAKPGVRFFDSFIPREIPKVLSAHWNNGTKADAETGEQSFLALLIKCFGDAPATRGNMATDENIESLIPALGDAHANALAMAALEKHNGKHPPITFYGIGYIEAQIQGPVVPSRDIAEIRLSVQDFPGREAEVRARAAEYQRRTGIKVVVLDVDPTLAADLSAPSEKIERFNQRHLDVAGAQKALDAFLADPAKPLRDYIADNAHASDVARIPAAMRDNYALAGDRLARFVAEVVEAVEADLAAEQSLSSGPDHVKGAIRDAIVGTLRRLAPLFAEAAKLHFDTEEQRLGFLKRLCSTERIQSAEDVRALHAQATAQAALLRTWAAAEPPPAAEDILATFANAPAGPDPRDVSAAAVALLRDAVPPITPDALQKLLALLDSAPLRGITAQLDAIATAEGLRDAPGAARAAGLADAIRAAAIAVADSINADWKPPRPCMVPLSAVAAPVRDAVRRVAPALADALEAAHPAHPAFPRPANPGALPADKAGRRQFLVGELAQYREKERHEPERGRAYHGRGHIARAYIFANAFCNILKEQGVTVDQNAVILGITGHDLGRQGLGKDRWEKQSADKTLQDIGGRYGPDAMDPAYARELGDCIEKITVEGPNGKPIDIPKSNTLEAQLLNAADCLDIGRTTDFDPSYFDFLRDKNGQIAPDAQKIRDQLIEEANILQRLTNPLCAIRQSYQHLLIEAGNADGDIATRLENDATQLENDATQKIIEETDTVDDATYFDRVENAIRQHPELFPLLTRYYLNAE